MKAEVIGVGGSITVFLLGQVAGTGPMDMDMEFIKPFANLTSGALLLWYLWYDVRHVKPKMITEFREELAVQRRVDTDERAMDRALQRENNALHREALQAAIKAVK